MNIEIIPLNNVSYRALNITRIGKPSIHAKFTVMNEKGLNRYDNEINQTLPNDGLCVTQKQLSIPTILKYTKDLTKEVTHHPYFKDICPKCPHYTETCFKFLKHTNLEEI